ncbi:MAG: ester cyclase [Thermoplasmata archaeon]
MSVEENIRRVTHFQEAFNARDWDRMRESFAESVVIYDPALPEPPQGPEAAVRMFQEFASSFPTSRVEKQHAFGQADWVCVENEETGGRKDAHKSYRIRTCYTYRVSDEGVTQVHLYYDALGLMTQIGMSPSEAGLEP